jgi:hypothetical protein
MFETVAFPGTTPLAQLAVFAKFVSVGVADHVLVAASAAPDITSGTTAPAQAARAIHFARGRATDLSPEGKLNRNPFFTLYISAPPRWK